MRGRSIASSKPSPSRSSSAAGCATWRRSKAGSARAATASSSAPRRWASPGWGRTPRRKFPAPAALASTPPPATVGAPGWAESCELSALDVARRFEDAGVAAIIYTDISRDGLLKGLNLDATIALAEAVNIPVIASGGLASIEDVKALLEPRANKLAGAIAGRALYDGRLDAAAALRLIRARDRAG